MDDFYKTVLLPVMVSKGDFCWDSNRICQHFDNEGGYARCSLYIGDMKQDKEGHYPKPKECLSLEEK